MDPDALPRDPKAAAALVVRVIDDIDQGDDEQRDALLGDLLCAAWATTQAQNQ